MTSVLSTWHGQVRTVLFKDGTVRVYVEEKGAAFSERPVYETNVNERGGEQ